MIERTGLKINSCMIRAKCGALEGTMHLLDGEPLCWLALLLGTNISCWGR